MRRLILLSVVGIFVVGVGMADGQTITLAGQWQVTWVQTTRNPQNALDLMTDGNAVHGVYTDDAGQSCNVSGSTTADENSVGLHVTCPAFTIDMVGQISADGREITGNETRTGVGPTAFIMRKQ